MPEMTVLTLADARPGFRLAGVRQLVTTPAELEGILRELFKDPAAHLLVIDERLKAGLAEKRLHELTKAWPGLVVTLPAPSGDKGVEAEDELQRLARRALGYHLRLRP